MTSSRVADLRDPTPTGGAKQQVFSSDRKRFIVLRVKTMSSHHRAAGTRQWKSRRSSSGRCSRRDGGTRPDRVPSDHGAHSTRPCRGLSRAEARGSETNNRGPRSRAERRLRRL